MKMVERIEQWPVDRLVPYDRNARTHSEAQVSQIAQSIAQFGFNNPVLIDSSSGIIAGHGRYQAARKLKLATVPVIVLDHLTDAQRRAYIIADNKLALNAGWDEELLAAELRDLDADFDLALTGFNADELDRLLRTEEDDARADECPDVPETAVTQRGDLWLLGNHRLLCGDATSADDVARLMDGAKARLIITSPPYNQGIDSFRPSGMHREGHWVEKVERLAYFDSMPEEEYQNGQCELLRVLHGVADDGGSLFYNHKNRYRDKRVVSPLEWLPGPFVLRQEIIWSRPGSVTQNARMFLPSDERIYWMYKGDDFRFDDSTEIKTWSSVWDIGLEPNRTHAVAFPVELPTRCIRACSIAADLVLDPYGGSGTTMIACERLARQSRLMEIDPKYCDVIVNRWQEFAGQTATLDGDGRTFAAIAEERLVCR